ncbi:response regulator [Oligoflexus tunisiensis]|uniref:response regulator n=1 Tax=Oligoflexus tunisiensis TaxID=708132 RepID=UPI00114D1C60|nr:response regulator [Oligoflexus tunisiensis]
MSGFPAQSALVLLSLGLGSGCAYAADGPLSSLWPWLSLLLALLLGAAIYFCFVLQKEITRLQHRLREQIIKTDNACKHRDEVLAEDRFRTTLFHGSSHELRTPLNGMMDFLQQLLQGHYGPLPQDARLQLSTCMRLGESLRHQIATILDLAEGRRGKLQLHNSRIALPQLMLDMETIAEDLRLSYPEVQFESKKLWKDEDEVFIHDYAKILMILRKLVSNAFKFGKAEERNHVRLVIGRRHRALTIEVSDQGVGLTSEQISRIFDDQEEPDSSGLGLAMVRILLRLMQGEMKISAEPQVGSRFTLVIPEQSVVHDENPVTVSPLAAQGKQEPTPASSAPSHNLLKMDGHAVHILVVDDNEINCEIIHEILTPQGYRVSRAFGGREALTRMRADRPDLVLLDLAMPEFSGEQVMQEKQLDSSLAPIPVILITARAAEEDRMHGLDLGADDYLSKPIIPQELVLRVRNILSRQRLTKRIALMEEREKLAQLGELITDLSREIRHIWAGRHAPDAAQRLCEEALQALPAAERLGPGFSQVFLNEQESAEDIDLEALPLPKDGKPGLDLLRALRLQLAPAQLPTADKTRIWQVLQELPPSQLDLLERVVALAGTHMHLMNLAQKSRLLMDGILAFHQPHGSQRLCRLDQTLTQTVNLLGPRLRLIGVRLTTTLPQETLMIHPADLMQVSISLITTLCQRLEMLLDQDKWLDITGMTFVDHVLLRFTCGGPRLTEAQALRLFDPVTERSEGSTNSGLHVARRIVLRAPGRLDFNLNEATTCFELELPKALAGIY